MPVVRAALPEDAEAMARVHVRAWQETYRGLMSDAVLDAPDAVERREGMWRRILADASGRWRSAVAVQDGEVVGIALSADSDELAARSLNVLYLLAAHHGSGAGRGLLDAVLDRRGPEVLWVADPNPRARAFYEREGFRADGASREEDGVREVRMVRGV